MRRPIGVLKSTNHETITSSEAHPDEQVEIADRGPDELQCGCRNVHVRDRRDTDRDVLPVVELEEEVAGDPEREEVHRRAADDLVGAQVDREERVDEREQAAGEHRDERCPTAQLPPLSAP